MILQSGTNHKGTKTRRSMYYNAVIVAAISRRAVVSLRLYGEIYKSRSISAAAFLPQAPSTPPPGWLAAPQR